MDISYLHFCFQSVMKKYLWTWQLLCKGYQEQFLTATDIKKHAFGTLDETHYTNDEIVEIAIMDQYDPFPLAKQLMCKENKDDDNIVMDKWLFVFMQYLYDHQNAYSDYQEVLDRLYADFGYPEEIKSLVSYMPADESWMGLPYEKRIHRYVEVWKDYLHRKAVLYKGFTIENTL